MKNIKKIESETLVSSYNITDVLQKCFDYYSKTTKISMQIEDGKHIVKYGERKYSEVKYGQYIYDTPVNVGEIITAETEYLGTLQGRITSARFSLNGGIKGVWGNLIYNRTADVETAKTLRSLHR